LRESRLIGFRSHRKSAEFHMALIVAEKGGMIALFEFLGVSMEGRSKFA
jgi:hypothetical protein